MSTACVRIRVIKDQAYVLDVSFKGEPNDEERAHVQEVIDQFVSIALAADIDDTITLDIDATTSAAPEHCPRLAAGEDCPICRAALKLREQGKPIPLELEIADIERILGERIGDCPGH